MLYDIRYTIGNTLLRYTIYSIRHTVYDIRYKIHDSRYTIHDIGYKLYDMRYLIYCTLHPLHHKVDIMYYVVAVPRAAGHGIVVLRSALVVLQSLRRLVLPVPSGEGLEEGVAQDARGVQVRGLQFNATV